MRTTLTLEDHLARRLKDEARRRGISFKEIVNEAIERGLAAADSPRPPASRFRVKATAGGFRAGVDIRKLNQLVDELELERAGDLIIRDR